MKNNKRKSSILQNNFYILKLVWRICPQRVLADFTISAIGYASWVFYSVIFIKYIMNSISNEKSFTSIVIFIVLSAVIFGVCGLFEKWYYAEYCIKTDAILYEKINRMLFDKASEVDLACYEDAEFYNKYTLAMKDTNTRIRSVLQSITAILFGVIAGIGVLINMFRIDPYVILFVIAPLIGNFVFGKWLNKIIYQRNLDSVPYQRQMDYVNRTVYLSDYAKEIRMSNIFNVLSTTYEKGYEGIVSVIAKYQVKAIHINFWQNIFTFLIIFQGVMIYSVYRTMVTKSIVLSEFTVLSSAMVTAAWILIRLSENIMNTLQNSLYIDNLRHFLEYQPILSEAQDGITPNSVIHSFSMHNVSFTYHGEKEPTLKNISLYVNKNEKIALVGHNGAGKTTLIKLMMRLYDPEEGCITLDDVNIKEYHLRNYRKLFATAFQDYQVFSMSVAENILMRAPAGDDDYELVRQALKKSGVLEKVMSLPKQMDTILTKEFDENGASLSGGELQKIAIARAFAKEFQIAVFDEPSSALDPIAEYQLYESMMSNLKEKAVIFISHRLSTAVLADRIYMLEDGRVIEEGTHDTLMKMNGKYADMFRKQAENYVDEYTGEEASVL